jgi:hypothetical protein
MENEKEWEKIRIEKEIREDLARLKMISSLFAVDLIGEVELRVRIQTEINELSLVAAITDLVYQGEAIEIRIDQYIFYDEYEEQIIMANREQLMMLGDEDYSPEKLSRKELMKKIKDTNEQRLIQIVIGLFKIRKEKLCGKQKNTTIEAKQMSLFFV